MLIMVKTEGNIRSLMETEVQRGERRIALAAPATAPTQAMRQVIGDAISNPGTNYRE